MKNKYNLLTLSPFCFSIPSIGSTSKITMLLLIPQIVMLCFTKSYLSLIQILLCIFATVCSESLFIYIKKSKLHMSSIVVFQGVLIGFFVPEGYNLFLLFAVTFIISFLVNFAFGGFAQSWANTVVIVLIMLYFLGTNYFPSYLVNSQTLKNSNIVSNLVSSGSIPENRFDAVITNFLNTKIFKYVGISVPTGYVSLFWDTGSIIPAFRFNLLTILATIVLVSYNYFNWLVPTIFLATYAVLVRIYGLYPYAGILYQGDMIFALGTSGVIMTAFFLLQWPGTMPVTNLGKIIYALLAGLFAYLIVGAGSAPIGAMFVVLGANICTPIIQFFEDKVYEFLFSLSQKIKNDEFTFFKKISFASNKTKDSL